MLAGDKHLVLIRGASPLHDGHQLRLQDKHTASSSVQHSDYAGIVTIYVHVHSFQDQHTVSGFSDSISFYNVRT